MNANLVVFAGRLARDPEVRSTTTGQVVCSFAVASERKYFTQGETKKDVVFLDVDMWGKRGEAVAKYFKKGDAIFLQGRLNQQKWEDKQTGKPRSKITMTAESFEFVNGTSGSGSRRSGGGPSGGDAGEPAGYDEVPF